MNAFWFAKINFKLQTQYIPRQRQTITKFLCKFTRHFAFVSAEMKGWLKMQQYSHLQKQIFINWYEKFLTEHSLTKWLLLKSGSIAGVCTRYQMSSPGQSVHCGCSILAERLVLLLGRLSSQPVFVPVCKETRSLTQYSPAVSPRPVPCKHKQRTLFYWTRDRVVLHTWYQTSSPFILN